MKTPIIFYPLTIFCLDDEQIMLETLMANISTHYPIVTFSSPDHLLSELKQRRSYLSQFVNNIVSKEENDISELQLKVKLEQLVELSNLPNRHKEVGVIISDYLMPNIDGIEFFKQLSLSHYKKILLTEHQNYQIVLSAFNDGVIDKFLTKSLENLMTVLLTYIEQLTKKYLNECTQQLRASIETINKLPISDKIFERFFLSLLIEMDVREYYLIDITGSFLLVNSKNEHYYLIIQTEESLNKFTKLYDEPDFNIFIESVINRRKIPFFGNIDPISVELSDWSKHLFVPKKINGETLYYWCISRKEH